VDYSRRGGRPKTQNLMRRIGGAKHSNDSRRGSSSDKSPQTKRSFSVEHVLVRCIPTYYVPPARAISNTIATAMMGFTLRP
jgi:hypothetical protein